MIERIRVKVFHQNIVSSSLSCVVMLLLTVASCMVQVNRMRDRIRASVRFRGS